MRRVVVTGLSMLTSLGNTHETWSGLLAGKEAFHPLPGEWKEFGEYRTTRLARITLPIPASPKVDRVIDLAFYCAEEAFLDAGLDPQTLNPYRVGAMLGCSMGGQTTSEQGMVDLLRRGAYKVHPASIPKITANALSGQLAMKYQAKGPNLTISTACSSSNHAIGLAFEAIGSNRADVMITGGSECPISPGVFAAFDNLRAMAVGEQSCRPFDRDRTGFLLGEGAAILILEEYESAVRRGARIYAEITGYGASSDAYHMVSPDSAGESAAYAIGQALREAKTDAADVDYINAHGTGTVVGDQAEAQAIRRVFGAAADEIPVSSIKGAISHTLGAGAAIEAAVSLLSLNHQVIPPTAGCLEPDKSLHLHVVDRVIRPERLNTVLSNSFGFGGNNSAVLFRRLQ